MSKVWDTLINIQNLLETEFGRTGTEIFELGMDRFNQPGWINRVWSSDLYRRAHVDVVDARDSKGLWMMHCCIFPHTHNPAPIYGFDVVAGKNKMTGCFHDYSKSFVFKFFVSCYYIGVFHPAWPAPRCPEIHQYHFAS